MPGELRTAGREAGRRRCLALIALLLVSACTNTVAGITCAPNDIDCRARRAVEPQDRQNPTWSSSRSAPAPTTNRIDPCSGLCAIQRLQAAKALDRRYNVNAGVQGWFGPTPGTHLRHHLPASEK